MIVENGIIKVKLGDIIGNYTSYYNSDLDIINFTKEIHEKDNTIKGISLLYFILSILFLFTYPFFGLLSTIIFHDKLYSFLYNYVEKINFYPSYFNEFLLYCKSKPKKFFGRLDLISISLILSLTTWFVFFMLFNSRFIRKYDWSGLYDSLNKKGYQPKKYDSWVKVRKRECGLKYYCVDGNHRHIMLLLIHGVKKKIDVILVDS